MLWLHDLPFVGRGGVDDSRDRFGGVVFGGDGGVCLQDHQTGDGRDGEWLSEHFGALSS